MDFRGLLRKFAVNRPLTEQEHSHRLIQKQRLDIEPHYQMSVIRMNSTYLESVDKWYEDKGTITAITALGIGIILTFCVAIAGAAETRARTTGGSDDTGLFIFLGVMLIPAVIGLLWMMRKESFAFTHYPIRFNRKTRMVHIFGTDGKVTSVPWDKIFFTLAQVHPAYKFWNVLGHVLADDGQTVKWSFALSVSDIGSEEGLTTLRSHWEFIRRYMEEGPQAVTGQVQFCLPLAEQRETASFAMHRMLANLSGVPMTLLPFIITWLMMDALIYPFRLFATRTSKIPRWPDDIEAQNRVDDDDPHAIVGTADAERVAVFPEAAQAAGVAFKAPPGKPTKGWRTRLHGKERG